MFNLILWWQVVKSQTQQALELADQMQKLQQDSSQLASTEQDLQVAEDRVRLQLHTPAPSHVSALFCLSEQVSIKEQDSWMLH